MGRGADTHGKPLKFKWRTGSLNSADLHSVRGLCNSCRNRLSTPAQESTTRKNQLVRFARPMSAQDDFLG